MMKLTKFKLALALVGLLASSCALAQAKYVWIDDHGVKQFSDTPPPGNIPEKNILKQPRRTAPGKTAPAPEPDVGTVGDDTKQPTVADREAEYNKHRAEQAAKDKKAADEAAKAQAKAENCTRAKDYLATLNSGIRMKTVDKDGQQSVMADDQHAKETERAQQSVNENCN